MAVRIRAFAAALAMALIGSLAVATGQAAADASPPGAGVTFTSQAMSVKVIGHMTLSPTAGTHTTGTQSEDGESRPAALSPKRSQAIEDATAHQNEGAASDNTNGDDSQNGNGTPAAARSFIGQQSSATTCSYFGPGCNPPDMGIAASPQFVFQGVNSQFEVLDTHGNVEPGWPVSAQKFFGIPDRFNPDGTACDAAHRNQPFLSDPRAMYDPIDKRFWAAMIEIAHVPALGVAPNCPFRSELHVAVSQTSNPNGMWNVYDFNTSLDGVFFNDFTQIGLNRQAFFASLNMFVIDAKGNVTGFYAELFEGNKSQMEHGQANFTPDGFFNLQATGPGTVIANVGPFLADTVQPAQNFDGSAGSAETFMDTLDGPDPVTGHLCTSFADACSGLALWRMANPIAHDSGGPAPTLKGNYVATKPFVFSPAATQPSCSRCIDANALDLRISGSTVIRDGIMYGAWETAANNGTNVVPGIEWAQVRLDEVGSAEAATTGYYNFAGDAAASYPALMPDGQGNVLMLFEHMSSTVFPQTRFIVKEQDGNFHGAGVLLKAGEDNYRPPLCGHAIPVCRWGDFEAASWDGAGHIWFAGEYANTFQAGPPQNGRNWGTWIGAIDTQQ